MWFDRKGVQLSAIGEDLTDQQGVALSPDGSHVAVTTLDTDRNSRDVWTVDLARQLRTRFTFDAADEVLPVWSNDGRDIFFASRRGGRFNIFKKSASGVGAEVELLKNNQNNLYPTDVSRDGKYLLFYTGNNVSRTGNDLWVLPLKGAAKARPFMSTELNELTGAFSPEGRWVAYSSNESGRARDLRGSLSRPGGEDGRCPRTAAFFRDGEVTRRSSFSWHSTTT